MKDIILTLVFSSAVLVIMIYPAMKITEIIEKKMDVSEKLYNKLTIIFTILLSLIAGAILQIT